MTNSNENTYGTTAAVPAIEVFNSYGEKLVTFTELSAEFKGDTLDDLREKYTQNGYEVRNTVIEEKQVWSTQNSFTYHCEVCQGTHTYTEYYVSSHYPFSAFYVSWPDFLKNVLDEIPTNHVEMGTCRAPVDFVSCGPFSLNIEGKPDSE